METNPIDEIRKIRHELGRQAGFSVRQIFVDLQKQRQGSMHSYIDPAAIVTVQTAANEAIQGSGGGQPIED